MYRNHSVDDIMNFIYDYERFSDLGNDVLHKSSTDIPLFMQNQNEFDDEE